jgi:hypothetical protein
MMAGRTGTERGQGPLRYETYDAPRKESREDLDSVYGELESQLLREGFTVATETMPTPSHAPPAHDANGYTRAAEWGTAA